jgi:hypothetical protein
MFFININSLNQCFYHDLKNQQEGRKKKIKKRCLFEASSMTAFSPAEYECLFLPCEFLMKKGRFDLPLSKTLSFNY